MKKTTALDLCDILLRVHSTSWFSFQRRITYDFLMFTIPFFKTRTEDFSQYSLSNKVKYYWVYIQLVSFQKKNHM